MRQSVRMSELPGATADVSRDICEHHDQFHEHEAIPGKRLAVIFFCLSVCLLLVFMDETIVATALVIISNEFDDFRNSLWVVLGYTLTFLGFAVLASRLADVYGRRLVIIAGMLIFVAFSFGSGFSQSMNQLIVFRTLQGLGGSMVYSVGILCFPEMTPIHLLPLASGIVGIVIALAGALGPVLGGVFTTYTNWRWIFWINPPIAVPTIAVLYYVWPKNKSRTDNFVHVSLSQLDWLGVALLLLFTTLFTLSVQQAGSRIYAWDSATIVVLLIVASLAFIALVVWSWMLSRVPRLQNIAEILPWRLLTSRVLVAAILSTIMTGLLALLVVIWLPVYFQIVNALSAVSTGVHLLANVCAAAVGAAVGGLISMTKNYTWVSLIIANALLLIGCGLFSVTPVSLHVPHVIYASQFITGFGAGMTFTITTIIVSLNTEFQDHALGQGLIAQARVIGGTLGVAMGTAVFGNHISGLTDVLSLEEIKILYQDTGYIFKLAPVQQVAVRQAFARSFDQALQICTYIAAISFVISLFVWQKHPPTMQQRKDQFQAVLEAGQPARHLQIDQSFKQRGQYQ